jgi:hypothetical protein
MRRSLGQFEGRPIRFRILGILGCFQHCCPSAGLYVKGATTLNSLVDVWLGATMLPSIDTFGTAVAAGAVQIGQFAASRAIRPETIIAVTVALWHGPAGGRLREGQGPTP